MGSVLPLLYEVNSLTSIAEAPNLRRPVPESNAQTVDLKVLQIKIPDNILQFYALAWQGIKKSTHCNKQVQKIWKNFSTKHGGSAVNFATGDKSIYAGEIIEK